MASEKKFTDDAMSAILRHNDRSALEPSNADIDPERTKLNYSFDMNHGRLSDYQYYKALIGDKYIYGRGTKREKNAVTGAGWVVTAPKEICGDTEKERAFFSGVMAFISGRYGRENIINNAVHYDEAGAPHIHVVFCPVTELDHDRVHYKTVKTKQAERLPSGRYEFIHKYKLDRNGQKIPLRNYARMADYYDKKISATDVLNKAELKNFHQDLQKYLDDNGIEGKVATGKTGGVNFTIRELKEFTEKTGLRLEDVREIQGDRMLLESYVEQHAKVNTLEELLDEKNAVIETLREEITVKDKALEIAGMKDGNIHKDEQIKKLTKTVSERDQQLAAERKNCIQLQQKVNEMEHALSLKQQELDWAAEKIKELAAKDKEIELLRQENAIQKAESREWGISSGWGQNREWGTVDRGADSWNAQQHY